MEERPEEKPKELNDILSSAVNFFQKDVEVRAKRNQWETRLFQSKILGVVAISLLIGFEVIGCFTSLKLFLNALTKELNNPSNSSASLRNAKFGAEWLHKETSTLDQIVIIPVKGVIFDQKAAGENLVESVTEKLSLAAYNPNVKAVILEVDSPGGSVSASDLLYHEVMKFKSSGKPIIAYFKGIAASGAYYISAPADKIVAIPSCLTGSIGVILNSLKYYKAMEKIGIEMKTYKSGKRKDSFSPFRPETKEDEEELQELIRHHLEKFVQIVSGGRKLTPEKILGFEAGIFHSKQALENGLIDKIGYLEDAVAQAAALAKIKKASVIRYQKRSSPLESLLMQMKIGPMTTAPNPADFFLPTGEILYLEQKFMPMPNKKN